MRRALHAAADSVEPSGDGLERIRPRLRTPYPVPVAWLMAACSGVSRRALGGWDSVWSWLHTVPGPGQGRWRAQPGTPGRRRLARGRMAAALAMAALVVAIGAYAGAPVLRQQVSSLTGALVNSLAGSSSGGTGGPGVNGQGNPLPPSGGAPVGGTTPSTPDNTQPGPANCPTQTPALATPPASQTPTASPTPTPNPGPPRPQAPPRPKHHPDAKHHPGPKRQPGPDSKQQRERKRNSGRLPESRHQLQPGKSDPGRQPQPGHQLQPGYEPQPGEFQPGYQLEPRYQPQPRQL